MQENKQENKQENRQKKQNPETKNQDIERNRFAKDPIKAGTSQETGEEGVSPTVSEDGALPEDEQTTLNTSGVQEGDTKKRRSA